MYWTVDEMHASSPRLKYSLVWYTHGCPGNKNVNLELERKPDLPAALSNLPFFTVRKKKKYSDTSLTMIANKFYENKSKGFLGYKKTLKNENKNKIKKNVSTWVAR